MNRDAHFRPLVLLGCPGEALGALARTGALRRFFVVRTPAESAVERLAAILKPAAVILEATEFYLHGRSLASRLGQRSRGSRTLFLDVERDWALWMEVESEERSDLLISPCTIGRAGETLIELLDGAEARSPGATVRMESAG